MEKISWKNRLFDFCLLLFGLLLIFGAGPVSKQLPQEWEYWAELLNAGMGHLGIGFFVTLIVKRVIEDASQREFLQASDAAQKAFLDTLNRAQATFLDTLRENVNRQANNILAEFVGRTSWILADPNLVNQLKTTVIQPDFRRPSYEFTLKLEPFNIEGDNNNFLKASILGKFKVKNTSTSSRAYEAASWLDDVIKLGKDEEKDRSRFTRIEIDKEPISIQDLKERGEKSAQETRAIFRSEHVVYLKYQTRPILPDETIPIKIEGIQIMRKEDHFVWNLTTVTEKLSVSIELLGGLTFGQLDVHPRAMHHVTHDKFLNPPTPQTSTEWQLKIEQAILPFQGIEIRWAPKHVQPTGPLPAESQETVS